MYTHKVFATVGLILIGAIVAIAGIWWYVSNKSGFYAEESNTTTTRVATTSASKDADATSNWMTYQTEDFSFKYPSDFKPVTSNGNTIITNDTGGDPNSTEIGTIEVYARVAVADKPTVNVSSGELGGKQATVGEDVNAGRFTLVYFVDTVTLKSSGNSSFEFICAVPIEGSDSVKTCNEIASTFKFL